jgi:hypothetical protein
VSQYFLANELSQSKERQAIRERTAQNADIRRFGRTYLDLLGPNANSAQHRLTAHVESKCPARGITATSLSLSESSGMYLAAGRFFVRKLAIYVNAIAFLGGVVLASLLL